MTGLYAHVPFCQQKCHYCDFVTTANRPPEKRRAFLEAFRIEAAHESPEWSGTVFDTLYVGGGTPSNLTADETRELFAVLRTEYRFSETAEITFEVNPADLDSERLRAYRDVGINRVSVGAQSFSDRTLRVLNRDHLAIDIERTFRLLRESGFENLNLDLMVSLPGETPDDLKRSLDRTLALEPEHVSVYELTVEPGTVFGRLDRLGQLERPAEEDQAAALLLARGAMRQAGYRHYELLNYAKPGRESRHNLIYWRNEEYLGLGPGAWSYRGGRRMRWARHVPEYFKKALERNWARADEERLEGSRRDAEALVLALRLEEGAPLDRFAAVLGRLEPEIARLIEAGLLIRADRALKLTERGFLLAETVFSELVSP